MPSSMGSSQPRDGTQVSLIAGKFFVSESPGKPILEKIDKQIIHFPAVGLVALQVPLFMKFSREWVASSFSRGSSQLRDRALVSCITADSLLPEAPGKP